MLKAALPNITVGFAPYGEVSCKVCTLGTWEEITNALYFDTASALVSLTFRLIKKMPCKMPLKASCKVFLVNYRKAVENYCNENTDIFSVPKHLDFGENQGERLKMPIYTYDEHLVAEYTGLTFKELLELDVLTYRLYLADAYKINILKRADGTGTEYLNECYNYMHGIDDI